MAMACEVCTPTYNTEVFDNIDADVELRFKVEQASRGLSAIAELLVYFLLAVRASDRSKSCYCSMQPDCLDSEYKVMAYCAE